MLEVYSSMSTSKRIILFSLLISVLFVCMSIVVWLNANKSIVLFAKLTDEQLALISNELKYNGINYKVDKTKNGSSISVHEQDVEKIAPTLKETLDVVKTPGLELFDTLDYSMSDFSQNVAYKRALQGELTRTIENMSGISSARVHITFSPKSLFSDNKKSAKASVYLKPEDTVSISRDKIDGIVSLLASSVEYLDSKNVSIFDDSGVRLGASNGSGNEERFVTNNRLNFSKKIETEVTQKIIGIMKLWFTETQFAVAVNVQINLDKKNDEIFDYIQHDTKPVILSKREKTTGLEVGKKPSKHNTKKDKKFESNIEFGVGRKTEKTTYASGNVKQLSVGVALRVKIEEKDLKELRSVLAAGLGIDNERGDVLIVKNIMSYSPTIYLEENINLDDQLENDKDFPVLNKEYNLEENKSKTAFLTKTTYLILASIMAVLALILTVWLVLIFLSARNKRNRLLSDLNLWMEVNEKI